MPNVEVDVCESCGRKRGEKHRVTTPRPSVQTMESWMRAASASLVEATDGCVGVDPDGESASSRRS